ncbi:MAG: GTPase ObgE [Clostridiales Family XIII bacterium]|jgi:GTP-binding protein|nr:GTPase ObgE [Clostridiales Family XIII bacterium]
MFVDRAVITIRSGKGGAGSVSFRREPYVPDGGPDGGDGGKGGDVMFVADDSLRTLMDFRYKRRYAAQDGQDGTGRKRFGKNGEKLVIKVPPGTVVTDEASGLLIGDLVCAGDGVVAAKGGKGGRGNVNFKSSVRRAPNFAETGGFATERKILLELKLIADVGLIGFPNVGKSTLLSAATSAKPKIGNYPFTTTTPNLGVVELYDTSFVVADIPGLIEGAHTGAGLGTEFLKHIERTKVLIHVVDVSGAEGRDPARDLRLINAELESYTVNLLCKSQLIAANKIDLIGAESAEYLAFKRDAEALGFAVFPVSAVARQGVSDLMNAAAGALARAESASTHPGTGAETEADSPAYFDVSRPEDDPHYRDIEISVDGPVYVLAGLQLLKIFNSTNFNDMGSVRYLYKHIEKSGAADRLRALGLRDGDTIRIRDFEFIWYDE